MLHLCKLLFFGDTNLSFSGYPEPSYYEPSPPYDNNEYSWSLFQSELDMYRQCIEDYVEAAKNDQERIRESINETVDSFNYFIQSLN